MKSSKVFPEPVTKHSRSFEWNKRAIPKGKKDDAMDIFEEKSLVARATDIIKSGQAFSRRG